MKDMTLIVWLTQLGLSVAAPLTVFVLLGLWLRDGLGWGDWVMWVCFGVGAYCAVDGFRVSLKLLDRISKPKKKDPPGVAFNDHD